MKVYVVTSGCYSDYEIEQIFLDEAKAKTYVKWHTDCRIEEFETHDDNLQLQSNADTEVVVVYYNYDINNGHTNESICFEERPQYYHPLFYGENTYTYSYHGDIARKYDFSLHFHVATENGEFDKEVFEAKYLKVCRDVMTQIQDLESQGYSKKQIEECLTQ